MARQTRKERIASMAAGIGIQYHTSEAVGSTGIKVAVHIPDNAPHRRRRINRIYDILVPAAENRK